jgi:hypothetical protein
MPERKRTNGEATIYKALHRKLKIVHIHTLQNDIIQKLLSVTSHMFSAYFSDGRFI